jgi:hypothetical protein
MWESGPLSTVAVEMKRASESTFGFRSFAFATALAMSFLTMGAPLFGVKSKS